MGEIAKLYAEGVPDDGLRLWTMGGMTDLTRYRRTLTKYGGVVCGYQIHCDGTDDRIDCGDLGNIQAVMMWIDPETTTEEILLVDAGNDIMVNAGVVTYTGLTPVATYVNGVASTALAVDVWQLLVCVFQQVDANNFELGWDGGNYGEWDGRDVQVFDRVPSADEVAKWYSRLKRAY